jgi:hypothetical protein
MLLGPKKVAEISEYCRLDENMRRINNNTPYHNDKLGTRKNKQPSRSVDGIIFDYLNMIFV